MMKTIILGLAGCLLAGAVFAETVVVVNPKNPVNSMTSKQVSNVFLGKTAEMPTVGAAVPFDLPEDSPLRLDFYQKIMQMNFSQMKSYWSKQVFTGKGFPPKEAGASSADVKKAVAETPGGIGYMEKSSVDGSVKVIHTVE